MHKKIIRKSPRRGREAAPREYFVRPKESRRETEELGPGKTDIAFCSDCNAVYYGKSWHHNLRSHKHIESVKQVSFTRCPACSMARRGVFEGEIRVSKVPGARRDELMHIVYILSEKARAIDPMDRVIGADFEGDMLIVKTSENQLAQRLAKKLHEIYKKDFSRPVVHKGKRGDAFVVTMEYIK